MAQHSFSWQDYVIFVAVLVISVGIGIFHACTGGKQRTNQEYFLGDRKLKFVPVGLSLVVTFQSALTFVGIPTEIYIRGISFLLLYLGVIGTGIIIYFIIVPLFYPLNLISTYEYLERRFQSKLTRILGSVISMLYMLLYGGVNIFVPALAIGSVSDIPVWVSIVVIGLLTTLYTSLGGLRAVVWTDVFQAIIMLIGLLALVIQGSILQGGVSRVWGQSVTGGRTDFGSWSFDPRERHTIWGLVIGGTFAWVTLLGISQGTVQRLSSVSSIRNARIAFLVSMPGFLIFAIIASLIGLIMYSYFLDKGCDPLVAGIIRNPNQLVIIFLNEIFQSMPGFSGLFVASVCCATLSTTSSCINGLSAMALEDIFKGRCKKVSPRTTNIIIKFLGLFYGLALVALAFLAMSTPGSLIQFAVSFLGAIGGPLLGMFLVGAFFPRTNWIGVSTGAIIGVILCMWLALGSKSIPPSPPLPLGPTTNCTTQINLTSPIVITNGTSLDFTYAIDNVTTISPPPAAKASVLEPFYRISYLWYSTIGMLIVLVVALVVSYLTGPMNLEDIDRELYFSPLEKITSILPESLARRCCCTNPIAQENDSCTKHQPEKVSAEVPSRDSPDNCKYPDNILEDIDLYRALLNSDETKV